MGTTRIMFFDRIQQEMARIGYSPKTVINYTKAIRQFANFILPKEMDELNTSEICYFLKKMTEERGISASYQNLVINVLRFYFIEVEGRSKADCKFQRPRKNLNRPQAMTREEISGVIQNASTLKNKCILMLLYGAGIRIGELLEFKRADLDLRGMVMKINLKGKDKARQIQVPAILQSLLQAYLDEYNPPVYLFEGNQEGFPIGSRAVQLMVSQTALRAGIHNPVTAQLLRNSFAIHLLESGADLYYLQSALGHRNLRTTRLYSQHSPGKIPHSPLENLKI